MEEIVLKPWGFYQVISEKPGHLVKRLVVNPNSRLSLQKHFHRSEHWILVSGRAYAQIGYDENATIEELGEHTYIPVGVVHRLEARDEPVTIIEVQIGICDEADIWRLSDDYDRDLSKPK